MRLISIYLIFSLLFIVPISATEGEYTTKGDAQNACALSYDSEDSLIMSAASLCLPGVLKKMELSKELKCEKVVCKYEAIKNGLDPTFCEKKYDYNYCQLIVGEVFALPGVNVLETVREGVASALANPTGILFSGARTLANTYIADTCVNGGNGCTIPTGGAGYITSAITLIVLDTAAIIQMIKDLGDNTFNKEEDEYCKKLDDIKEDLENLLKHA